MGVEAEAAVVDGRRKEDEFQVGWMTFSTLMLGHSMMMLGRATTQDSLLLGGPLAATRDTGAAVTSNHDEPLVKFTCVIVGDF